MASFGDVRRRTILLFVFGIGLPSSLLGYLALRGIRNDQALLERERRGDLRRIASVTVAAHDSCLVAAGLALDSALAMADSTGQAPQPSLSELAARHPLVEVVFRLSRDGAVDEFVAPDLLFHASDEPAAVADQRLAGPELERLEAARRLELRDGEPSAALVAYQRIVSRANDPRIRAEALGGTARIHRETGDLNAAAESYRRLQTEFGRVRTAGGVPYGIAAQLELGHTQTLAGDTAAAAQRLIDLYAHLVRTERGLSRAQFGFIAARLRESVDELISDSSSGASFAVLRDTVRVLVQEEEQARARTDRLLAFQSSGGAALLNRAAREPPSFEGRYDRVSLDLGGFSFYLLLREPRSEARSETAGAWGLLLDPDTLEFRLVTTLRSQAAPQGIRWTLRGASGEVREASGPLIDEVAAVSSGLPGGVPPFTIDLFQPGAGFVRTVLTSRRGVYFYAFLLLAGILIFGLTLTVVTVSHQLRLARMQSDFVSTVSHEFKSPLTAVRQIAEMLQSGKVSSEEKRKKYYDVLLEQGERLSLLINRVLDFARMDSGHQTLDIQPVDVGTFLEDLVSQVQQRVGHEGYMVRTEIETSLPRVPLDADALGQAVTNLIDNAIKYSGESRKVVVRGSSQNGFAVIAVQDFGIGLDPKDKAHVFERFYRGGDELTRSVRGTGLGLTLVKQIVEAHGGHVEVESEPGKGSTFTIRLPLEVAT
jgi:signal transduction histidine kinase